MTVLTKTLSNFAQGEISPEVQGRVDIDGAGKIYGTSLAYQRNFISTEQGPFKRRTGTLYLKEIRNFGLGRNIPFVFNDTQAYLLSFSDRKLRFIKDNQVISGIGKNITAISKASNAVITIPGHKYNDGDPVYISGVLGMTPINDAEYTVSDAATDTFKIKTTDGVYVDSSSYPAYTSGGQAVRTYIITNILKGATTVVSVPTHALSNGDEVFISGVTGMVEVNGAFYIVSDVTTNTFKLKTLEGVYVDSSGYTAFISGGTVDRVYEIKSPYAANDLKNIQFTQNADVVYLTCTGYAPRKLTRVSDVNWTLKSFTRTTDPFYEAAKAISGIVLGITTTLTATAHGYSNGDEISIHGIVGTTQLNDDTYIVSDVATNTLKIKDLAGNYIDSSGFTAWSSAGSCYKLNKDGQPVAVAFDVGRLWYGGTTANPDKYWGSKGPKDNGDPQYDDFSVSSPLVASDAVIGVLPSSRGKVDSIRWISSTKEFLVIGTFAALYRITGATTNDPIVPNNTITVKPLTDFGCYGTAPEFLGESLFYIQRNALKLRSLGYQVLQDSYGTEDRNLIANRITSTGITRLTAQSGRPDVMWCLRSDGKLAGLSYKGPDDVIEGWHRHDTEGDYVDICALPRQDGYDTVYVIVKREVNGTDKYYIEYFADEVQYPTAEDYVNSQDVTTEWLSYNDNYTWEVNKNAVHIDCAVMYDGSDQEAKLTYAIVDDVVTVTADKDVFYSTNVGRQIWLKYKLNGTNGGRLVIEEYVSATQVKCSIRQALEDYTVTSEVGDWFLTAGKVTRLEHLEGRSVAIVIDGALHKLATVSNGEVTLEDNTQASKIIVGLNFVSIGKTNNINNITSIGNTYSAMKTVGKLDVDVLESGTFKVGTDLRKLETVLIGGDKVAGRVTLPKTNIREVNIDDSSSKEKHIYVVQDLPYPLTVRGLTIYADTNT